MKAHIGVDAETGVVHSMTTTPANHHDITEADKLLHGEEASTATLHAGGDDWQFKDQLHDYI